MAPAGAAAGTTFSSIVVFGDSLSDSGNDFALSNAQNTPPYDGLDPAGFTSLAGRRRSVGAAVRLK